MPLGFVWAVYTTDDGRAFGLRVDRDLVSQGDRGWVTAGAELTVPFPRGWLPRRVRGIDTDGNIRYARAGRLDAPIWTGAVSTFLVQGSDQVARLATIVGRQGERIPPVSISTAAADRNSYLRPRRR